MTTTDLPHSTPSAEGVDAAGIEAFLDAIDARADIEPHGLIVLRHGHVIAEGWWTPYGPERVHLLYSLSKSFTSSALGFAVAEGLVDLDATVLSYFPELDADISDERSRSMKVRHIASMASGHSAETLPRALQNDPTNMVRGFLLIPPDEEPGSVFAYNQPCTYTVGAIVQRLTGQTLVDYLRPRLFDPLGIGPVSWIEQPARTNLGFSGLHATTDAIARLGQLYLQRGRWGDRQLLSEAWVDEATHTRVENPNEPNPDWRQGYGFQFWMARHGYRGDGAFGQFSIVLPEQDMVIAINSATVDMQAILDAVWEHVLPAVDRVGDQAADARLTSRLSALALPVVGGRPTPDAVASWSGSTWTAVPNTEAVEISGRDGLSFAHVGLGFDGATWLLTLTDHGGSSIETPVGTAAWTVTESHGVPLACSGGWDGDTFVADVIFLETPHRLRVSCPRPVSSATVTWMTVPLHPRSVLELRAP